ncbi:CRISPR-associated endonuclease Cas2 [Paenibacillus sp. A3]|uniref:CRISPR-associated endonuclease Cas2 n=1 Tax=Paenibacillus sp. A3 TaxID=1337054 RepID=UPI000B27F404
MLEGENTKTILKKLNKIIEDDEDSVIFYTWRTQKHSDGRSWGWKKVDKAL